MDLLDKLQGGREAPRRCSRRRPRRPGATVIERVLGPCEVVDRRPADADVRIQQLSRPDAASRGGRTRRARRSRVRHRHDRLADGERHASPARRRSSASSPTGSASATRIIFSTGYQANLSLIGGLCGAGRRHPDRQRQPREHLRRHAPDGRRRSSASGTTRPRACARSSSACRRAQRNRLVVAEGLYSIRGDVAPLREIVDVCRAHGAYLMVDEAHSLGTYGADRPRLRRRSGRARSGRLRRRHVLEIAGRHRRRLRVGSSRAARAAFPRARVRVHRVRIAGELASVRAAVRVVREHPELRDRLWANISRLRAGLQELRLRDWRDARRRSCRSSPATRSAPSRSGRNCSPKVCM